MQDQGLGSSSNSFFGNFYFNDGLESDLPAVVPDGLANDGHASMRWIGQSGNDHGTQNHVGFSQFLGDDFWLSPLRDRASGSSNQSFEGHSSEPNFNHFPQNNSMSSGNGHMISCEHGPIGASASFPGPEANSGPLQHNLDLNAVVHDGSGTETSQDHGPYLSLNLFRSGDHIPTSGGSSSPVMIYSGIAGYVLEENINGEGLPTDGQRRLLCKRRAPEFASGHGTYGASSSSAWQAGNSEQSWVTTQDNHLNSSHSGILAAPPPPPPPPSHFYQMPNEAGHLDNFQRNTRLRRTAPLGFWSMNSSDTNVQATNQPSIYSPVEGLTITSSAVAPVPVNPAIQSIVQISANFVQPSQYWNGTGMPWVGSSSTSHDQTANMREAFGLDENIRNNTRNMMIPLVNIEANLSLGNGNANFFGNIASSSRNQSGTGVYLPSSSLRFPQPSMAMRDIIDPSGVWRHGDYCPIHSGALRDMDVSMRGGNPMSLQVPLRLGPRAERHAGHHSEISATLLSQAAAQRRSRLVSEVRNALGLVRRPGGLRLQDVMVLDPSYLYDMHDDEDGDFDDDMRLDVDNMSYEELLELEEEIGNVSIGLSEESILANLRRRIYQSITIGSPVEAESCCICQEDYASGEELGKLDCGHDFHFNCIKPWLVQKNSCPICKKTALAI